MDLEQFVFEKCVLPLRMSNEDLPLPEDTFQVIDLTLAKTGLAFSVAYFLALERDFTFDRIALPEDWRVFIKEMLDWYLMVPLMLGSLARTGEVQKTMGVFGKILNAYRVGITPSFAKSESYWIEMNKRMSEDLGGDSAIDYALNSTKAKMLYIPEPFFRSKYDLMEIGARRYQRIRDEYLERLGN